VLNDVIGSRMAMPMFSHVHKVMNGFQHFISFIRLDIVNSPLSKVYRIRAA